MTRSSVPSFSSTISSAMRRRVRASALASMALLADFDGAGGVIGGGIYTGQFSVDLPCAKRHFVFAQWLVAGDSWFVIPRHQPRATSHQPLADRRRSLPLYGHPPHQGAHTHRPVG